MEPAKSNEITILYQHLIEAWNRRSAIGMSELFTDEGLLIGFDGSQSIGSKEIFSHLTFIFESHLTAPFVCKVKNVRFLSSEVAMLQAIAGMVPLNEEDINPQVNTHHTLVAVKKAERWLIELFQNTPAQFHGRTELVEQMSAELRELLK